jgi:hypothetical protein
MHECLLIKGRAQSQNRQKSPRNPWRGNVPAHDVPRPALTDARDKLMSDRVREKPPETRLALLPQWFAVIESLTEKMTGGTTLPLSAKPVRHHRLPATKLR